MIDSYSDSSGRSSGRSTPDNGDLRFIMIDSYSDSSGRSSRSTPRQWWFEIHNDRFLLWELRQIKWQIYPSNKMAIWDSYWQIPALRAQADQVADLPPRQWRFEPGKWQFEINTDRLLLWELRQTRWEIKWQMYPPKWWFEIHTDRFLLWQLRQIKWQIYPSPRKTAISDSYW